MGTSSIRNLPRWFFGFGAIIIASYMAMNQSANLPIVFASVFFILICTTDIFFAKIHNLSSLGLVLLGFTYHAWLSGPAGLLTALLGLTTGFALLIIPYLMGGMGAGDVKAMAALGALSGPAVIFQVFFYVAFVGALISILHLLCSPELVNKCRGTTQALRSYIYTRDFTSLKPTPSGETLRFPYAAAIALGYFAHIWWGNLI